MLKKIKEVYIYALYDPRDESPKYIGKTINLKNRFKEHINPKLNYKDKNYINKKVKWILDLLELGLEPKMGVVDIVAENDWQFWEMHYISLYKSWGFNLTNTTKGGNAYPIIYERKPTEEQILKIITTRRNNGKPWVSESQKEKARINSTGNKNRVGKKHSEIMKENYSKVRKETCNTKEFKEKMKLVSLGNKNRVGKKASLKTKQKLRDANLGKKLSIKTREKMAARLFKKVNQYDLDKNLIKTFDSLSQIKDELGLWPDYISKKIKQNKSCYGFIWEFYKEGFN